MFERPFVLRLPRRRSFAVAGCALLAVALAAGGARGGGAAKEAFDAAHWRAVFARPEATPAPADNPTTPDKVALGRRLFEDKRLSGSNEVACASCHQSELSFSDGVARHKGLDGEPLARRTPPLWNLAWALTLFWDGRAASLEDQARMPVENSREMGGDLAKASIELSADADMRARFAAAFPQDPTITPRAIAKALAAYERTLVSPPTRFDRWVKGDDNALSEDERAGLALFVGKAGCVSCHTGWRFTDEAFHDIGLPVADPPDMGRGAVLKLPAANHAFKTPSLRERVWSAPYMHDGSMASFEDVVAHYSGGVQARPTLSADLNPALRLDASERAQLVAFLGAISSEDPPRPIAAPVRVQTLGPSAGGPAPVAVATVGQKGRRFTPGAVRIEANQALTIVNDDKRTHNVRVDDPRLRVSSGAQEPGDKVVISFPQAGRYAVICGIHPEMRLDVTVTSTSARSSAPTPANPRP